MLKGAIVGFGEVARHGHWPAYATSADVAIVAVVERTAERRWVASQLSPALVAVETVDELDGLPIDFFDICTPPALHAAPMLAAVTRGCHVLCEKPFLLDPRVLDTVRRTAARQHAAVMPVHNWKYAPILRAATASLRAGAIGALRQVEIETLRVRDCAAVDPLHPNWRRDPAIAGGGILMDHGWHAVYLAIDWFGSAPRAVDARLHRVSPDAAEDEAAVTLEFERGSASIALSWNADVRRNTVRLRGERGEITVADDTLVVDGAGGRQTTTFTPGLSAGSHHDDWFAAMLPDIVAAFREPALAVPPFEEAARTLGAIRRAYAGAEVQRAEC